MLIKYANARIVDRILDPNKIAAMKIFPNFDKRTAAIEPIRLYPDKFAYLRNRSISALETHGANQNGDGFPRTELKKAHKTFIGDPVTLDHTEGRVIGMVLDSVWVPKQILKKATGQLIPYNTADLEPDDQIVGDWVENILAINKKQADLEHPNLTEQILDGEVTDTSMGTMVDYSVCSIPGCRKQATIPNEYCNHVASFKGRVYSGADTHDVEHQVYEENYGLTFFEDSVIIPDKLGGTAGGEGADPGAKMLEQVASKQDNGIIDLTPYIVNRKANLEKEAAPVNGPVNYGEQVEEIGEEPESVEKGREKDEDIQKRNNDELKSKRLKLQVQQIVDDLEDSLEHLKMFTDDDMGQSPEDSLIHSNKHLVIEGNIDDLNKVSNLFDAKNVKYTLVKSNFNQKNEQKIASVVEFTDIGSYKLSSLMRVLKTANINCYIEGGKNMKKGQKIVVKSKVKAVNDDTLTLSVDKAEMPVTEGLLASLNIDANEKIIMASKKKTAITELLIKKADDMMGENEIKEGDDVEIPAIVSEEANEEGTIVINLDIDAETEFEDQTVPVDTLVVPETDIEIDEEESEGESSETSALAEGVTVGDNLASKKKDATKKEAMTPGKEPAPKDKVPDAGKNAGDDNKAHNEELSTLQKRYTPKPKDKVPDAGKHAAKEKKADVVDPNINAEAPVTDAVIDINDQSIDAAIKQAKQTKKAEYPEEMSYEGNTSTIPKDQGSALEVAAEEDYLAGEHDQSKEPENNVTQLSSKVTALEQKVNSLTKENSRLVEANTKLIARLKPLEVASLVQKLVSNGSLQNNKMVIKEAIAEYSELYDVDQLEFQASIRIANNIKRPHVNVASRKVKEAVNNMHTKEAFSEAPVIEAVEDSIQYADLNSGEFFEDSLH